MSALADAIAKYRQSNTPTLLATFLYIYTHASHESYIIYLAPIDLGMDSLLDMDRVTIIIPDMLVSYELMELAKVIQPHTTIPLNTNQIENAIYEYLTQPR